MNYYNFLLSLFILVCFVICIPPVSANYYVQQGDTVYLNTIVDISGVTPPYIYLAYWDGFDMYDSNATYAITLPTNKRGYWEFSIDPKIFGNRLGRWYRWDGVYERNGNNLAFIVAATPPKPNTSKNITLQNPNQTPIVLPPKPILPDKHVADYVVSRGTNLTFHVNNTTNVWIFGSTDYIYDFHSVSNNISLQVVDIEKLSPGSYTILLQTHTQTSIDNFTIRYNPNTSMIEWFDPTTFKVLTYNTAGQTPENVMNKLKQIIPESNDVYRLLTLEVQLPYISINQLDTSMVVNSKASINSGINLDPPTYLDIKGYTNAPSGSLIKLVIDPQPIKNIEQIFKEPSITYTEGNNPGNLRTFHAIVPINMYNLSSGRHFISAKTELSDSYTTASFYIYDNAKGNFIPNKTIRYISGQYGDQEMIPTPTPVIIIQNVTQIVTQVVTVPVTPSDQQVYAQQKIASEKTWWEGFWFVVRWIISLGLIISGSVYIISVLRRLKDV
jgi:hypothetical protein